MFTTLVQNSKLLAFDAQILAHLLQLDARLGRLLAEIVDLGLLLGREYRARCRRRALPFCSSCSFSCVWLRLSSSSLILPRYCCCARASISRTTVSGRVNEARLRRLIRFWSPANCSTRPWANDEVAVARHDELLAEHLLHFDRRAVGEHVDVGDEHDRLSAAASRRCAAGLSPAGLGSAFSSSRRHRGRPAVGKRAS